MSCQRKGHFLSGSRFLLGTHIRREDSEKRTNFCKKIYFFSGHIMSAHVWELRAWWLSYVNIFWHTSCNVYYSVSPGTTPNYVNIFWHGSCIRFGSPCYVKFFWHGYCKADYVKIFWHGSCNKKSGQNMSAKKSFSLWETCKQNRCFSLGFGGWKDWLFSKVFEEKGFLSWGILLSIAWACRDTFLVWILHLLQQVLSNIFCTSLTACLSFIIK